MPPTNPDLENPQIDPETPPELAPLTQEDLDKAVAESKSQGEEQMKNLENQHRKDTNELIATMNQQRFSQQQPAPQAVPGISSEEFAKAIEEGEVGTVSKYFDQKLEANNKQWEEKLGHIQSYGQEAIGNLAKQQAANSSTMPYYNQFKDEIDALLLKHNAGHDPVSIQNAYTQVTGQNIGQIVQMEIEKKARQGNPPDSPSLGGGKGERGDNLDQTFNMDTDVSADSKRALQRKGLTPDQYTEKMNRQMGVNFENFESMHKQREELIKQDKEFQW